MYLDINTWDGHEPFWHWHQSEIDYIHGTHESGEQQDSPFYADSFNNGGPEMLEVSLEPGRYVVTTGSYSGKRTTIAVEASSPLIPLEDAEASPGSLAVGESVTGLLSFFLDLDSYRIDLQKGDTVRIQMVSLKADSVMSLYLGDGLVASSDDAAIGLYGDGAEIVFEAWIAGRYDLDVTAFGDFPSTYVLTLDHADTGNPSC